MDVFSQDSIDSFLEKQRKLAEAFRTRKEASGQFFAKKLNVSDFMVAKNKLSLEAFKDRLELSAKNYAEKLQFEAKRLEEIQVERQRDMQELHEEDHDVRSMIAEIKDDIDKVNSILELAEKEGMGQESFITDLMEMVSDNPILQAVKQLDDLKDVIKNPVKAVKGVAKSVGLGLVTGGL